MSNFRRFPYEISREIFVLNYCITNSTLYLISKLFISYVYVSYIKIVLNFISILHIVLRESVWNFSFFLIFFFFIFLVRHENRDEHCEFLILADIKILTRVLKLSHTVLIFKNNVTIGAPYSHNEQNTSYTSKLFSTFLKMWKISHLIWDCFNITLCGFWDGINKES